MCTVVVIPTTLQYPTLVYAWIKKIKKNSSRVSVLEGILTGYLLDKSWKYYNFFKLAQNTK